MVYKKLLTISIAAYNVEEYIGTCLESLCNSEVMEQIEILVIDDGGTDSTMQIASEYVEKFPNTFTLIRKENGGWGSTVNIGIEHATGKYFKQLDGDDYFRTENLADFLHELEKTEVDLVLTPLVTFDGFHGELGKRDLANEFHTEYFRVYPIMELGSSVSVEMHACAFKTAVLRENRIKLLEHAFYTDAELVTKALYYTESVLFLPMPVYYYRRGREGQSVSLTMIQKHYREHIRVIDSLATFFRKAEHRPGIALARRRFSRLIFIQYIYFSKLLPTKKHLEELRAFDRQVRIEYADISDLRKYRIMLGVFRKMNWHLWFFLCRSFSLMRRAAFFVAALFR